MGAEDIQRDRSAGAAAVDEHDRVGALVAGHVAELDRRRDEAALAQ